MTLSDEDYQHLLALRSGLRRFERWGDQQVASAGLTYAQHQLLLAVRGHGHPRGPTIGDVAAYLLVRHHSAVELADRAQAAGLVERRADPDDQRVVRLSLTDLGRQRVAELAALHAEELRRLAPLLDTLLVGIDPTGPGPPPDPAAPPADPVAPAVSRGRRGSSRLRPRPIP